MCQMEHRRVNVLVRVTGSWEIAIANPLPPDVVQAHAPPRPGPHSQSRVLRTLLRKWAQVVEYVGATIKFSSWWTLPYSPGQVHGAPTLQGPWHPKRG